MSQYTYTGTLTDIGVGLLAGAYPQLRVRPESEAFGPDGVVSAAPVPVTLSAATGRFAMTLYPSGELTPTAGGSPGVDYILEASRFETALDGSAVFTGLDVWRFTAVAGGGNIGQMLGGSLLAVWMGPPWPSKPYPKGLYIDIDGDWTVVS